MCCPLFFGLKYEINAKKKKSLHLFVHLDPGPHRTVFPEHLEEGLQYLWGEKKTFSDTTLLSVKWDILWIFVPLFNIL